MDEASTGVKGWLRKRNLESISRGGTLNTAGSSPRDVDFQLWHACAGAMVHLPKAGARVIYFPQGHAEQAACPSDFHLSLNNNIPCRVLNVQLLADTETDEVYARIGLQPELSLVATSGLPDDESHFPSLPEKSAFFAKTLTQSDANNGGGFSVPRFCAENIFPVLDYTEDPPVQVVHAKDVHGVIWKFRHIFRGTPRRHLLTTGWSNFVNQKKLVAGDAIVFLRSSSGELCVGVRRSMRGTIGKGSSSWNLSCIPSSTGWELKPPDSSVDFLGSAESGCTFPKRGIDAGNSSNNFSRNRIRVTSKSVMEAAGLAAAGHSFEVVYYPRATISEFCVKTSMVEAALKQSWAPGLRFKMAVETEDAFRISWFMGTITKVEEVDPVRWPGSPWKMLQVSWDEPDLLHSIVRVSPWQVEPISPMQLPPLPIPKKKIRSSQTPDLHFNSLNIFGFPMAGFTNNSLGHTSPWHGHVDSIPENMQGAGFVDRLPTGMQGARHERTFGFAFHDFEPNVLQPGILLDSFYKRFRHGALASKELPMGDPTNQCGPGYLSTPLTVGGSSGSGCEPAPNGSALNQDEGRIASRKAAHFVLFGKTINIGQSEESQPAQFSVPNTSNGHGHDTVSGGSLQDNMHLILCDKGNGTELQGVMYPKGDSMESTSNEVGTLGWFRKQASKEREISMPESDVSHCKVFLESNEVGWSVDLSIIDSYDDLYEKLSSLFGVHKLEILNRVISLDSVGASKPIGDEPYRDFVKKTRRLKILLGATGQGEL